jgi:RNA polymerase sigma-70 factor, ECF subfamily
MGVPLAPLVGYGPGPGAAYLGAVARTSEHAKTLALMSADRNLEILMARYQAGDFAAATELIETVSPQLYRFFAVQVTSRPDAADLLQETWLRIHKVRHTYRPGEPVLPWFYAIARYVRVDHYRKTLRSSARTQTLEQMAQTAATPTRDTSEAESLRALLAVLPDSQREVIELLKVEGLSLEEVARATSTSVGSVKQKAHRAYQKLRKALIVPGVGTSRGEQS